MKPVYAFTDAERDDLAALLGAVGVNPYTERDALIGAVTDLIERGAVPPALSEAAEEILAQRAKGVLAHSLGNCPIDPPAEPLDQRDPLADKYVKKTTYVAETFLELFGQLVRTPLMSYANRFNGDFYIDVIAHERYFGKQTGYSDGELAFHNDRTAHPVRADYITLLGMRCPAEDVTYTSFISAADLADYVGEKHTEALRRKNFYTPFDVVSKDNNAGLTTSDFHSIFYGEHGVRYVDTHTTVAPDAPTEAKDALIALKDGLVRCEKLRHRIREGDLFTFANQDGLHSREHMEINDLGRARTRWLLKTYAFRDADAAAVHADRWVAGIPGRVGD